MPLSRMALGEIGKAAADIGASAFALSDSVLFLSGDRGRCSGVENLCKTMLEAGATLHYPAVLVYREGRITGPAIVGYKTAVAYRDLISQRVERLEGNEAAGAERGSALESFTRVGERAPAVALWSHTVPMEGSVGAYFRWIPGTYLVAVEVDGGVQLVNVLDGSSWSAPGDIDLVPSPDGRILVSPDRGGEGLRVFDAGDVFAQAAEGTGRGASPTFVDPEMRDYYPSVGLLESISIDGGVHAVYRVLTSWSRSIAFRDYQVEWSRRRERPQIRPRGDRTPGCPGLALTLPILAHDARRLAARDDSTGTTKIFALANDGACVELLDLGLATGKVAWDAQDRHVAFTIPRGVVRDGSGVLWLSHAIGAEAAGVFVLDLEELVVTRIAGSDGVHRLTFPDFIGRGAVVFNDSKTDDTPSAFHVVCCVY